MMMSVIPSQISQDQVMMSHSPLKMFRKYHEKCVLVSGQGPVLDIAKKYPFIHLRMFWTELVLTLFVAIRHTQKFWHPTVK